MSITLAPKRAELHVSASQIKTWLMCPRKYQYRYVLGLQPEHRSGNLV
jgi:CRISPR/Cas system-associated exonuclease Cas4 (RecB family)